VPESAVADQINHHIRMERLTPLSCKFAHADYRLHIVAIDVEYRSAEGPGDVGAVPGRPAGAPIGRGGDPVVQNDVDGPSGGVVLEGAQVERLVNHSLAGEGTVTVDEDAHGSRPADIAGEELLRARLAHDDGVVGLEVAGTCDQ